MSVTAFGPGRTISEKHGGSECVKTPTHNVNEVNKMNVDNE